MWAAHHFPGLLASPVLESVARLTPEETNALTKPGREILDAEAKERLAHTKAIATAAGMRVF